MASTRRGGSAAAVLEPEDAADAAGLRYVRDDRPGIRRVGTGSRFRYVRPGGSRVRDPATLARIRRLAIPPAYRDVWICPDPRGHVQATGRDARGRKQYRYHPRWREHRDETKFDRMLAFSRALPAIRRRVARDLARRGLPREKVLAAVVRLLEDTCVRVGNEEYARANDSYGLTTLRDGHVAVAGERMRFEFPG
jgi:DNA topoisomerase-1